MHPIVRGKRYSAEGMWGPAELVRACHYNLVVARHTLLPSTSDSGYLGLAETWVGSFTTQSVTTWPEWFFEGHLGFPLHGAPGLSSRDVSPPPPSFQAEGTEHPNHALPIFTKDILIATSLWSWLLILPDGCSFSLYFPHVDVQRCSLF